MDATVVKNLKDVYKDDATARAILDVMSTYVRGVSRIKTHMMERHLRVEGHEFSRSHVIAAFRKLEVIGIGKYVEGRRGAQSRFELVDRVTVISRLIEAEHVEDVDLDAIEIDEEEMDELISHTFHLRPGVQIEVELPADLTQREADRLSQFFGCLAMSDDEEIFS